MVWKGILFFLLLASCCVALWPHTSWLGLQSLPSSVCLLLVHGSMLSDFQNVGPTALLGSRTGKSATKSIKGASFKWCRQTWNRLLFSKSHKCCFAVWPKGFLKRSIHLLPVAPQYKGFSKLLFRQKSVWLNRNVKLPCGCFSLFHSCTNRINGHLQLDVILLSSADVRRINERHVAWRQSECDLFGCIQKRPQQCQGAWSSISPPCISPWPTFITQGKLKLRGKMCVN